MSQRNNELLFRNGTILTLDAGVPDPEAVLVQEGRIASVGSAQEALSRCKGKPQVIDLAGRTLLPGFIESHMHPSIMATTMLAIDCSCPKVASIQDIAGLIRQRAQTTPAGNWIRGWGYDDTKLAEQRHPTRWDLDQVAPHHPVYLRRTCVHMGVANSAALKLSGIDGDTPDPEGGHIQRDPETGEPTGLLMDRAQDLIEIAPYTEQEKQEGFNRTLEQLSAWGVTTVHDMLVDSAVFGSYQTLALEEGLSVRLRPWLEGITFGSQDAGLIPHALALGLRSGFGNERMKFMGMKFILDGSIGGRSAAIAEPYLGTSDERGILYVSLDELAPLVLQCVQNDLRVSIHAIGERAIEQAIVALEHAADKVSMEKIRKMRNRIDHCVLPTEQQLARIKNLGAVVESSVSFIYVLGDSYLSNLGVERSSRAFPNRSCIDRGIPIAGNSDCPVCDGSPLLGMYAATTRKTGSGQVLGQVESITTEEALRAYTVGAAYAGCEDHLYGTITPGKMADLIVLAENPIAVPAEALKDIDVEMTLVNGTLVYSK